MKKIILLLLLTSCTPSTSQLEKDGVLDFDTISLDFPNTVRTFRVKINNEYINCISLNSQAITCDWKYSRE